MTELPNNLDTILHIGAGSGDELPEYLKSDAKCILLVEPNPNLAEGLRQRTQGDDRVQVIERAITDDQTFNQLTEYNLPEAASLYQPTGLRQIFPGLRVTAQHPVTTSTPQQLLEQHALGKGNNLLVLQAPGAELMIVKALANTNSAEPFSHLWLTCPNEAFYDSSSRANDVLAELQRLGYDVQSEGAERDDWPQWWLSCNRLARKVQALETEKQALTDALKQTRSELEYANATLTSSQKELTDARNDFDHQQGVWQKEKEELKRRLEDAQQAFKAAKSEKSSVVENRRQADQALQESQQELEAKASELQSLKAELDERKKRVGQLKEQLEASQQSQSKTQAELQQQTERLKAVEQENGLLKESLHQLQNQLDANTGSQKELTDLKQRMEYLFEQNSLQLEQAANALGRHVSSTAKNTARELQAGITLQQQLGADYLILEEQGNRLPSTVALQLSRQIKTKPYELIIEMGSGVTTSFLAHTLRKQAQSKGDDNESGGTRVARYVEPSDDDLPKRILCFEHNRTTVKELEQSLKKSGLSPIITLQYAPLVSYQYQGREYLYYDCTRRLQQVAQLFEARDARILVLLNDTKGDSRPDRVAALPQLLQYLSAHSLDLVINSASADSQLVTQWHQLLESRGLDYQPATDFGSAAVQLVKVNP